jgi:MSHA biogenesis protein MshP
MKRRMQRGFGAIMAIIIVVILAALSAALVTFGNTQQLTSAQDMLSARAWAAARTGNEWGLHQALRNGSCPLASTLLNLSADTGFWVTVTCVLTPPAVSLPYNEGESAPGTPRTIRVFRIESTACNSAAGCPDNALAVSPGYIERKRQVIATN